MRKGILSVQLPALCPLECSFCRTPDHGEGDVNAVQSAIKRYISGVRELYLTSNGETGLAVGFKDLVRQMLKSVVSVSVLCATPASIVEGLQRVEVSYNAFTKHSALAAIKKAREMGIPVVASLVDDGSVRIPDLAEFADQLGLAGVVVRALQAQGRSTRQAGKSRSWQRDGADLGQFPVAAYSELDEIGEPTICINHWGKEVLFLGATA